MNDGLHSFFLAGGKANRMSTTVTSSSLIVVSNRLPFVLHRRQHDNSLYRRPSAGGLVTAVAPVMVQSAG